MHRHPRLLAVCLVLGAFVLAGCGGNPKPKTLPPPSPSPSATASPSPTAPVLPAAAKAKTKAGAIAFAGGFIETVNFAGAQGNTTALRKLYVDFCTRCESLADGIDKTYADGGSFDGGSWSPTKYSFYGIKGDVAYIDALVDYDAQTWVPRRGAKPRQFPASQKNLKALNLRWVDGTGWRVSALDPNR